LTKKKKNMSDKKKGSEADVLETETDLQTETEIKKDENGPDADQSEDTQEPEENDPVKILEAKVKKADEEATNSHDRLLRATAEFDNYKKRSQREITEFRKFANESLIKDLLPVMDNLERAIESSATDDKANKGILEGVEMTLNEIYKVLEKFNLKPLESDGKPFDPNFHQAVLQEETDKYPENTVLKVMQKGYILHDRLIRPAMVVVSKSKTGSDNSSVETSEGHADN